MFTLDRLLKTCSALVASAALTITPLVGSACAQGFTAQIIGGDPTPSLVDGPVAFIYTGDASCSGLLVGSRTVITAGHCTADGVSTDDYRVLVGGQVFRVSARTTHPYFDPSTSAREGAPYDVGVLELEETATVDPIPVFVDRRITPGTQLTIAGYGTNEHSSESTRIEDDARVASSVVYEVTEDGLLFERHSGGRASTCPGDSGGPAILRDSGYRGVVGTLSIGTNILSGNNCELAGGGIFAHVYLQSAVIREFLSNFPDIQYISGHRIFIQSAAKSSVAALRKVSRSSSLTSLQRGIKNALVSVNKARSYADGTRLELLSQAVRDLKAGVRGRRLTYSKSKIKAAIELLRQVEALGVY